MTLSSEVANRDSLVASISVSIRMRLAVVVDMWRANRMPARWTSCHFAQQVAVSAVIESGRAIGNLL
jgi:hypothetical protein